VGTFSTPTYQDAIPNTDQSSVTDDQGNTVTSTVTVLPWVQG
jgi:hypothetical protein